jgi:EF-hand domain pair
MGIGRARPYELEAGMFPRFAHRIVATVLTLAAVTLIAAAAIAQSGIMVNEALLMDDDLMTMLDTDSTGILSADEYAYFRDRLFDQNNVKHEAAISAEEYAAHAKAVFADMDANSDGFLTPDEIKAAHMSMLRLMYKSPHAPGLATLTQSMMTRMDTNHDGKISAQEYADAMKARFDEIDSTHEGKITKKQFEAVHFQHKAEQ